MINKVVYWSTLSIFILSIGCQEKLSKFDKTAATEEILRLHNAQRDYHFGKDSIAFANQMAENFISVNRGVISKPTIQDNISRYHGYFSAVEFIQWDDMRDPIIRFSDDGSMAYTIVEKKVKLNYTDPDGNTSVDSTHFAWTTIYSMKEGEWKIENVTSTNIPAKN